MAVQCLSRQKTGKRIRGVPTSPGVGAAQIAGTYILEQCRNPTVKRRYCNFELLGEQSIGEKKQRHRIDDRSETLEY